MSMSLQNCHSRVKRLASLLVVVLAGALASCGGGGDSHSPPSVASIAVTPTTSSVADGLTVQLTATATLTDHTTQDVTHTVKWTSSNPAIAAVDSSTGLAHAMAMGSTNVSASDGSVAGSTQLSVTAATLQKITISPSPIASGIGYALQLTASGTYSDGSVADVTTSASWTSSNPSTATVGNTTGLSTGVAPGSTTVTAAVGAVSGTGTLTVSSPVWLPAGNLSQPRYGHTATLLTSGKVLVVGGQIDSMSTVTATTELYDPASNSWTTVGSLATGRTGHTATLLNNGKVLVTGGFTTTGPTLASSEIFDPATGTWSAAAPMLNTRAFHTATLLPDGKVLAAAGSGGSSTTSGSCFGSACNLAEVYDPATDTWAMAASLTDARYSHTATLLANGKVLVASGHDVGTSHSNVHSAELYDPATDTWSAAGTLATARYRHAAALLPDGRSLALGGFGPGNSFPTSVEAYDPGTNLWSSMAPMSIPRVSLTASALPDGRVLAVGGETFTSDHLNLIATTAEIYDPTANSWSAAPNPITRRTQHAATTLQDGAVLVTGGIGAESSAEVYR